MQRLLAARLQSMAVFDETSGAEKPHVINTSAQNSYQVRIMSELGGKSNKICIKKQWKLELWGQIEVQNLWKGRS